MDRAGSPDLYSQIRRLDTTQRARRGGTGWVVALTGIGSLMAALDTLVVSTALSRIRLDLGASVEQLEWTVNAYNLTFAVLLITGAALGDRYGRRNLYAAGLGLFAAASAACAVAPDVGWLIAARAVQGAGAALVLLRGLALVTGGALGIVWALVRGNQVGWATGEIVGSLAVGALLVWAFVAWELRARAPMLPVHFFRDRAFAAGNTAMFFTFASLFGAVFFNAQLLQVVLGYGPLDAGLRLIPWTATFITVAPIAGALADRIGERPLMIVGLLQQAAGMSWLALIADPGVAYSQLLALLIVAGVGISMAIPAAQNSGVGLVALEAVGKAAGANSMMRELGGVFGVAVAVSVFAATGGYASAAAFADGFAPAIGLSAGLALAGAVAAVALPRRREATGTGPGRAVAASAGQQRVGRSML